LELKEEIDCKNVRSEGFKTNKHTHNLYNGQVL